jgi:uncharacterized protein (DUF1800 family)
MGESQASAISAKAMRRMVPKDQVANAWTMLRLPLMPPPEFNGWNFVKASHAFPIQATEMGED